MCWPIEIRSNGAIFSILLKNIEADKQIVSLPLDFLPSELAFIM